MQQPRAQAQRGAGRVQQDVVEAARLQAPAVAMGRLSLLLVLLLLLGLLVW
jgi:hypothetical protein